METRIEEVGFGVFLGPGVNLFTYTLTYLGFEVFPERCGRGTVSYLEGARFTKNWGVVTKRIRQVFN